MLSKTGNLSLNESSQVQQFKIMRCLLLSVNKLKNKTKKD